MGVQLDIWRARIGVFSQPVKCKSRLKVIVLTKDSISMTLRILVFMCLMACGDVEANPGPPKQVPGSAGRQTRQTSIYFPQTDNNNASGSNSERRKSEVGNGQTQDEMFAFLRSMKEDMDSHNVKVRQDIASMDNKIDSITTSINDLKTENEQLKQSNIELKEEMKYLRSKIDNLESHSRRSNLRINGIMGSKKESWEESEQKVRDFIADELNLPEKRNVDIERAHRIRSNGQGDDGTIIVKFSKYKDSQCILQKANTTFDRNSRFSVQQDYTDRVKRHRRELGKEMVKARESGRYASIRYDKLVIDNKVYRYDDSTSTIVCIGNRIQTERGNHGDQSRDRNRNARTDDVGAGNQGAGNRTNQNEPTADEPDDVTH